VSATAAPIHRPFPFTAGTAALTDPLERAAWTWPETWPELVSRAPRRFSSARMSEACW